ncbi:hypothetical protein E1293_01280 [Actinomadura darangshiensis]|uniref:Aminoglycoside phosphotransferase domain-containing protein n=1 Tax=Actinomadura darangshiensis TaxID=705336 RepID=A0A4R5C2B1_9ACTN|nr:phosphotransferase [Actinomadura darangshiensis]TDD92173.1 hypothetical protein E1293_01280 [Actinomadura darangshiensis]
MRTLGGDRSAFVVHPPVASRWKGGRDWVTGPVNHWFVRGYTRHDRVPDWLAASLVEDAARKLALVHRASIAIEPGILRLPGHALQLYDWALPDVLGHIDHLVTDMRRRERDPGHIRTVWAGLHRLRAERPGLALGPEGLTHHDLRPENLLVRDGEVVEIIDWDRAHWDVQWYDVALAGLHLASLRPADPRWDLTQVFIDAYGAESGFRLSVDALAWLFRFTAIRNFALTRSPGKWARLLHGVGEQWGDGSVLVDDLVA